MQRAVAPGSRGYKWGCDANMLLYGTCLYFFLLFRGCLTLAVVGYLLCVGGLSGLSLRVSGLAGPMTGQSPFPSVGPKFECPTDGCK